MTVRFSATTHVGRVRKINEDSILSMPDQKIWVVADGMGGHAAGDFASQTIVDTIAMIQPDLEPGELMRGLRKTILQAHDTIRAEAEAKGQGTVGATVVALIMTDEHFVAFWAGDSRLYRFRDGEIEMLTTDHSLVAELVLSGQLTWDEAEKHPQSNAITRAVGVGEELELDKIRGDVAPGDRYLICSDGLTKYATFDTLTRMVVDAPIETVADSLLSYALDSGGADNISIIVVDVI
ncbi:MAG: protein phosphatase 2C domain-containing protein [Pseudorhodobacter sp.]|jgi:serine/threonine protein phosphatase Stp1|nr:protein phosphatase 2C domain-containing protein [Pseudorhodobacter sp.]